MNDFALYPEDVVKLDKLLLKFRDITRAEYILFCHRDGSVIAETPLKSLRLNSATLSVLASASYSSAIQIGQLVGENSFHGVAHRGERLAIHISPVGDHALVLQIYDAKRLPAKITEFTRVLVEKFRGILSFLQSSSI